MSGKTSSNLYRCLRNAAPITRHPVAYDLSHRAKTRRKKRRPPVINLKWRWRKVVWQCVIVLTSMKSNPSRLANHHHRQCAARIIFQSKRPRYRRSRRQRRSRRRTGWRCRWTKEKRREQCCSFCKRRGEMWTDRGRRGRVERCRTEKALPTRRRQRRSKDSQLCFAERVRRGD